MMVEEINDFKNSFDNFFRIFATPASSMARQRSSKFLSVGLSTVYLKLLLHNSAF